MPREPFWRECVCMCVCMYVYGRIWIHTKILFIPTWWQDFTAKTVMTLAPMFCTQPFMTTIYLGNVSFFFLCSFFLMKCQKAPKPWGIHCLQWPSFRCSVAFYPSLGWEPARIQYFQCKDSARDIYGPKHFESSPVHNLTSVHRLPKNLAYRLKFLTVCMGAKNQYSQS